MTKKRGASAENKVMVHNQQLQNAAQEGNPSYLFPKEQPRTTGALFVSSALDAISGGFHAKAGLVPRADLVIICGRIVNDVRTSLELV